MKLKNGLTPQQTARAILLSAAYQAGVAPQEKLGFTLTPKQEEELCRHMEKEYQRIEKMFAGVKDNVLDGDWSGEKT